MRRRLLLASLLILSIFAFSLLSPRANLSAASGLAENETVALRKVVPPKPGEDLFDQIPWQTSIWEARVLAAKEGKPILLWEMDGHPLGCG
jgi:hypothetical protein